MLTIYRGDIDYEIPYKRGNIVRAYGATGNGVFYFWNVKDTNYYIFNISDFEDLISLCGTIVLCLSGEFNATVNTSWGSVTFKDIVYSGVVTRTIKINVTGVLTSGTDYTVTLPAGIIQVLDGVWVSSACEGENLGVITGLMFDRRTLRIVPTQNITGSSSGQGKTFYLSFTFSQLLTRGE